VDARGWLLTNSHVYLPPSLPADLVQSVELTARPAPNGTAYKLELIARDPLLDIALFRLPTKTSGSWTPVMFTDSNRVVDAKQSVTVFVLGYPLGNPLSATTGTITNSNAQSGRFQTQAPINHGNSGGPVFDSSGGVVAMVHGGIDMAQNMNYLIPINYARGLLLIPGIRW